MFLTNTQVVQSCINRCYEVLLRVLGSSFPCRWAAHYTNGLRHYFQSGGGGVGGADFFWYKSHGLGVGGGCATFHT